MRDYNRGAFHLQELANQPDVEEIEEDSDKIIHEEINEEDEESSCSQIDQRFSSMHSSSMGER